MHKQTEFAAKYPFWCNHCRALIQHDAIVERVQDGDWGDYTARFHSLCGTEVSQMHLSKPRRLFGELMAANHEFSMRDVPSRSRLELAFLAAYGDFRSGHMEPDLAVAFEQALKLPPDLIRFLSDNGYVLTW